ncbi:MAG: LTA synthase family protein [Succinivibrionaceae bacterium]
MKFFLFFLVVTVVMVITAITSKIALAYFVLGNDFSWDYLLACLYGIKFDNAISSMLLVPSLIVAYVSIRFFKRTSINALFGVIPLIILVLIQVGDGMYSLNAQKHVTNEARQLFTQFSSLFREAFTSYSIFMVILFLIVILIFYISSKIKISCKAKFPRAECALICLLLIFFIMIRGFLSGTPLRPSSVYQMVKSEKSFFAMNGAYSFVYNLFKNNEVQPIYKSILDGNSLLSDSEINEFKFKHMLHDSGLKNKQKEYISSVKKSLLPMNKYNIIIFLLESWPACFSKNFDKNSATPFLDEMSALGLSVKGMLADGKRTHEGYFSSICSMRNPLGAGVPRTNLDNFDYYCLPELLSHRSFIFQGTTSDLVGDFALKTGVNKSFGKIEQKTFTTKPFSIWGVQDYDLLNFVLKKVNEVKNEPFLFIINNTDTHVPKLPKDVEYYFGNETDEHIEKSMLFYVDSLLKDFYTNYKKINISRPTIFIFTGDHTRWKKTTDIDEYLVPFIMFSTDGSVSSQYVDSYFSQLDIVPTLLSIEGLNIPFNQGHSILNTNEINYPRGFFRHGEIEVVYKNILIKGSINNTKGVECFDITNPLNFKPITCTDESISSYKKFLNETYLTQELLFNGETYKFIK